MKTLKNILVAIDFEEKTLILVEYARMLAGKFDSKLWFVHVAAPEPDFIGYDPGPQSIRDIRADDLKDQHQLIQTYTDEARRDGIESEGLLIQGSTVLTIVEKAKKLDIDLIIIGSHEHGFLYNTIFENTTLELLKRSSLPVLAIPLK